MQPDAPPPDDRATPSEPHGRNGARDHATAGAGSLFGRVKFWVEVIGLATPVAGGIWYVLMLFNPVGKDELTVRIERRVPISLPSDVRPLPLRLQFEGKEIERAVLVELEIRNTGSAAVQPPGGEKRWRLDLRSADGSAVVPAGPPTRAPGNLVADVARGPSPDRIVIELGVMDPRDTIRLAVILINPAGDDPRPVIADTPERMTGVRVVTTDRRLSERLREGFVVPIFAAVFAVMLVAFGLEHYILSRDPGRAVKLTVGRVLAIVAVSFFISAGVAWTVAGVIAWGVDMVLYRS